MSSTNSDTSPWNFFHLTEIVYQICFFVKTVKYWVYFLGLSVKNHERLVR